MFLMHISHIISIIFKINVSTYGIDVISDTGIIYVHHGI